MLNLLKKISPSHEELFIEQYDRLLHWALQLTEHDRELAEDLLHDAFIHFTTLTQPDLKAIRNLDGYLYMMLRNLHISQERRSSRARFQQLSIVEYESAATGLRTIDSRDVIRVQDELRRICHYACARKEKAKLASVLILRFFHGYYPSEIAQILRSPRPAIDKWLQLARAEAKVAITEPKALSFTSEAPAVEFLPTSFARTVEDPLRELRQTIFRARTGDCFARGEIKHSYQEKESIPLNCERLSHAVSCAQCLDEINQMLKLAPLSERYPTDSIGKDMSGKSGPGGEGGGGVGGGRESAKDAVRKYQRGAREAFEHHPLELCVSVNGYIQGSHKISSEFSEFDLSANTESVRFVEVFSEQGIRLLLLNADEPPPSGADTQTSRARLSDGRAVELTLKYRSTLPTLHVIYRDPTFNAVQAIDLAALERGMHFGADHSSVDGDEDNNIVALRNSAISRWQSAIRTVGRMPRSLTRLRKSWFNSLVFSRPVTVTVLFAILLSAVFLLVKFNRTPAPPLSAANLLRDSTSSEEVLTARTDQVIHRTITLEERKSEPRAVATGSSPQLIATRKIEVWRSAEKGITARRLYDERGQLIAGDWRRADGVQTIYHHGVRPQLQLSPEKRSGQSPINFENVWQLDIAAKDFSSLIGNTERARVEERANSYVISAEFAKSVDASDSSVSSVVNSLLTATLVLNRADLRAIEQTLVIRQGNETREYRFVETTFEQKPKNTVAPTVFDPEPILLSKLEPETRKSKLETAAAPLPLSPSPRAATPEDEVEVLRLLNQAGVFLRDQVSVTRSPGGQLIVGGVVETDERKRQIVNALASVTKSRMARVEVETVQEVLQRQQARAAASETVIAQGVQVTETQIPVDTELRKYQSSAKGLSGDQLDSEVRQFSERMLARSNQARLHVLALRPVIERFSPEELQALTPEARNKWRSIVIEHVRNFAAETAALHRELAPLFPTLSNTAGSSGDMDVASDADLIRAVKRLTQLASANDEAIRRSFSISANGGKSAPVRTTQFWSSLANAEALAAKIQAIH
jgi:RNA polymerase sigma factor (sigma-70 family)